MTSKKICQFNQNAVGDGLLIGEGNLTLSTISNVVGLSQSAHGDLLGSNGVYFYECYLWSSSRVSMAGKVRIGIVDAADTYANTKTGTGNQSAGGGYGYDPAAGIVYNNNTASGAAIPVQDERVTIGVLVYLSPSSASMSITVNGSPVWSTALTIGKSWLPSFTISGDAGDIQLAVNFGQYLFEHPTDPTGWNIQTPGLDTIYLSLASEGFLSASSDTPANTLFKPAMLNPANFSFKREVKPWPHRDGGISSAPIPSAFASIDFDNSRGDYNSLLRADTRGATLVFKQVDGSPAPDGGAGQLATAATLFTACVDLITAPLINVVRIALKDNIARLDIGMQCARIPLYADSSSAGQMMPFGIGAQRNFTPPLIDAANRIYQLGDQAFSNIQVVRDRGAPLDQASQYSPVGSGKQIKLNQDAIGKLSIDGSTLGQQPPASGVVDVLAGIGEFATWTAGVPNGWVKPTTPVGVTTNGSIALTSAYGTANAVQLVSRVPYLPVAGQPYYFGYWIKTSANYFLPGRTYNISYQLLASYGNTNTGGFGLALLTALSSDKRYWITDFLSPQQAVQGVPNYGVTYTAQYTVPATFTTDLPLYICAISRTGGPIPSASGDQAVVVVDNIHIELLGQYTSAPLLGASLPNFIGSVLQDHANEPASIYSSADCYAIDNAAQAEGNGKKYVLGRRWNEQPNVIDAIQEWLDNYCGVVFTDETNKLRFRRMIAPELGTPIALFDTSNMDLSDPSNISIVPDQVPGLTNQIGARRNCDPLVDSDFVSDTVVMPRGLRESFKRISQFPLTSNVTLAAEYQFALGQFRFESLFDDPAQAIHELDRVMSIWAPKIDDTGLATTKRTRCRFKANYTGALLGAGPSVAPQSLYPLDVITIDLPSKGLNAAPAIIMSIEVFPFSRRCIIEAIV